QQEPGMERKLLVVFALTFLVIMLFQPLLKKYGPQPPAKPESSQASPVQNQVQLPSQTPTHLPTAPSASAKKKAPSPASAPLQAASESETVIENDVYRIVFTNRGGRVKSWVLKKYTDEKGGPLELVNSAAAEKYGYPLTLWTYDETLRNQLNAALYVATSGATAPAEIKFAYAGAGLRLSDVAGRVRRQYDRSAVRGWPDHVSVRQQGRAPGDQEDQRRRHPPRTVPLGGSVGPVFR